MDIVFYVGDKLYEARVFQFQPTAIIIPDQNVIAVTTLSPHPDSSTSKNRNKNDIETDGDDYTLKSPRSIIDCTGRLNPLSLVQLSPDRPFACNYRYITVAARSYTNPK